MCQGELKSANQELRYLTPVSTTAKYRSLTESKWPECSAFQARTEDDSPAFFDHFADCPLGEVLSINENKPTGFELKLEENPSIPCQATLASCEVPECSNFETFGTRVGALKNRKHTNSNRGFSDQTTTVQGCAPKKGSSVWRTKHSICKEQKLDKRSKLDFKRTVSGSGALPLKTLNDNLGCGETSIQDLEVATL